MEALEIKTALEGIKAQVETKATEQSVEVKGLIEALETKLKSENEANLLSLKADLKSIQEHADKLDVKLQAKASEPKEGEDLLVKLVKDSADKVMAVKSGSSIQLQTKAVANMTVSNLSGTAPRTFNFDIVKLPSQSVNIEDFVGTVTADNGIYTYTKELAGEGSIGAQTEGATKNQRDYDFQAIDVNTDFIAGFARYSKKMRNNLSYIVNTIPMLLRRDYYKSENSAFQTILASSATASTELITGNTKVGMLINEIGKLQDADRDEANLIIVKPTDYLDILKTAKQDLASAVTYEGGVLRVAGVQVLKASSWLPANKYYVGDWSRVNKVVTEGIGIEFSMEEGTNFVNNNITARIEAQVTLVVEDTPAVVYGDFTATA